MRDSDVRRMYSWLWTGSILFCTAILSSAPIPTALHWFWPSWSGLFLLYLGLDRPESFGIFSAAVVGLLLDILHGDLWGCNALSLALMMRLQIAWRQRLFLLDNAWRQTPLIFLLLLCAELVTASINLLFARPAEIFFALPAAVGALLWIPMHLRSKSNILPRHEMRQRN